MEEKLDIIAIGESLVELSTDEKLKDAECLHKYYGGDALATAVTAVRLGSKVGFITKLGNDAFKDFLLDAWKNEGLDISQVTFSNERNGLYLIARPTYLEKDQEEVKSAFRFFPKKENMIDKNAEYKIGDHIIHTQFGEGVIVGVD